MSREPHRERARKSPLHVTVPRDLHEQVLKLAEEKETSISEIVSRALMMYFERKMVVVGPSIKNARGGTFDPHGYDVKGMVVGRVYHETVTRRGQK